jgi:hypothetical protein
MHDYFNNFYLSIILYRIDLELTNIHACSFIYAQIDTKNYAKFLFLRENHLNESPG